MEASTDTDRSAAHSDPVGLETLRRMAQAPAYGRWIADLFGDQKGRRVLEVGCGIGNMTGHFLSAEQLVSIDLQQAAVDYVSALYRDRGNLRVLRGDISDPPAQLKQASFDSLICVNVLEHIEDHRLALCQMRRLLKPGGLLNLQVPAVPALYGTLDIALGHRRRYTVDSLSQLLQESQFRLRRVFYMNLAGVFGWFVTGRLLKRELLSAPVLTLFDRLVPLFRAVEKVVRPPVGQSVVAISERVGD